ncbi:MAG TPA: hypothetical protein VL326_35085 [Kofleriaceae bacterium]|nr:hypothetical protein [Kofleriaceae bacterium]
MAALGAIIVLFLVGLLGYLIVRALMGDPKLTLLPGEYVVRHIFAECKQIRWSGFVTVGGVNQGKLLLTNQRLIYANPSMTKQGFAVTRQQIQQIHKNMASPMRLELTYLAPNGKPKYATFMQLAGGISGVKIDPSKELPIGMFIDQLSAWREGRAA